jgi:hypothetical protein
MANFHSDKWIRERVDEHLAEARSMFPEDQIVGIFLQGSQNYGLDYEGSDIDTKLITTPSFREVALNKKPVPTTHIRENDEHIDLKDIRLYIETFRKQNLNFLEILFTDYFIVNPLYEKEWNRLLEKREEIARMNPFRAVKSMKGIALEKYHAMEHRYPSKIEIIDKYGYDPKQVSHLIRVEDYLERYINGESYLNCLRPSEEKVGLITDLKHYKYDLVAAREIAEAGLAHVTEIADSFCEKISPDEDPKMRELLEDVCCNIIAISIKKELLEKPKELGLHCNVCEAYCSDSELFKNIPAYCPVCGSIGSLYLVKEE